MDVKTDINYNEPTIQWTSLAISHVEYPSGKIPNMYIFNKLLQIKGKS